MQVAALSVALWPLHQAFAADSTEMLGRWTWDKYTIEVRECADKKMCAKVVAGPKNVGLEIFASALTKKGGDWFGEIVHPESKAAYNTRLSRKSASAWRLDGCTSARVCLSGEFVRAK